MKARITASVQVLSGEPGMQAARELKKLLRQWGADCGEPVPFAEPSELKQWMEQETGILFVLCPDSPAPFQTGAEQIAAEIGLPAGFRKDALFGWAKDELGCLFFLPASPEKLRQVTDERTRAEIEGISGLSFRPVRRNLFGRLAHGQTIRGDWLRICVFLLSVGVFCGAAWYLWGLKRSSDENLRLQEETKDMLDEAEQEQSALPEQDRLSLREELTQQGYPREYLTKFFTLYQQNQDLAGWLSIPGTMVDYAVVQAKDNDYYMRRDFTRAENRHGVPFVDFRVNLEKPSTNIVIYGHNMNDGQMFGELLKYKNLSYYREHPVIQFDSVYREGQYKIFGVVLCKSNDPEFNYHNFIQKESDAEYQTYLDKIAARTLIKTPVDVNPSDTILTLSTCDYAFKAPNGERIARLVIFARRVRDGEPSAVAAEQASNASNPLLPPEASVTASAPAPQSQTAAYARYLSVEERRDLSPRRQKALAEARRALETGEIPAPGSPEALWLSREERSLPEPERQALMASRQALAAQAGIDPSRYSSWAELFAAISAPGTAPASATTARKD